MALTPNVGVDHVCDSSSRLLSTNDAKGVVVARKLDASVKIEGGSTLAGVHVLSIDEQGTKVEFRLSDARDAMRFTPGQRVLVGA